MNSLNVLEKAILVFEDEEKARLWFITKNISLNNKTPEQVCNEGNEHIVLRILNNIEFGGVV